MYFSNTENKTQPVQNGVTTPEDNAVIKSFRSQTAVLQSTVTEKSRRFTEVFKNDLLLCGHFCHFVIYVLFIY